MPSANNNIRNSIEDDMVGTINTNIEDTSPLPSSNNISSDEICGGGSPHNYDAAADQDGAAAAVGASMAQSNTVEIMDNDIAGMPLTPGMAEAISYTAEPKETRRLEIMEDDTAPVPPAALQDSFNNAEDDMSGAAEKKSNKQIRKLKISNEGEDEGPTHPMEYEDNYDDEDVIAKKKAKEDINNNQRTAEPDDLESVYDVPDMERDTIVRGVINTGDGTNNRRGLEDFEARARTDNDANTIRNDEEEGGIVNDNEVSDKDEGVTLDDNEGTPLGDRSTVHIPEAFLVEDISVYDERTLYDATPILPWWKQRRMRVLLGVMFVLLAAMAIALGVTLSSNNNNENNPVQNVLILPSDAPSSSLVPTSSPTTCVHKISENAQVIDLQKDLQIDSPYEPKVAVDGRNMVVVAKDETNINEEDDGVGYDYDGPVFITFYSLDDEEKWQRIQTPIRLDNMGGLYEVALSGATAFVGFPYANNEPGIVLVYEQNQFGEWEKVEEPLIHDDNSSRRWFGRRVEVDGDLACIRSTDADVYYLHLYHREDGNKWVQFDTVDDGWYCSISGDTIAVTNLHTELDSDFLQLHKYNQDLKEATPIQEPITPTTTMGIYPTDLSNNYLVYTEYDWNSEHHYGAFIYKQDVKNQTFTFHQQLNITGSSDNSLSLDNDLLVVGGTNRTHIFSLQNDEWVETITLDQVFNDCQLSGRTLIATSEENEVYSFNIQDCMQAMPTQTPSISVAPSFALSSRPSMSPSSLSPPSLTPSSSVSPTSVRGTLPAIIKVRTDNYGGETGYAFESINTGQVLINKPKGSLQQNTLYEDTLFLNEGQRYRLTIKDSINGIESPGYFAVDVDGEEIFYGGRFNTPSGEKSFIVRPGYELSNMSTNDRLWLNEHNKRRRQFHEDNGVPYGCLVWSNELEDSARAWIPQITSSCSISGNREPGLSPGENIAVQSAGTNITVDESPVAIMQRWVDNKTDLGYPNNLSATQALWAATRFVGCSNAVTDMADGRKCYVSICRYAQAGNCDMGKWKDSNGNVDWEGAATSSRSRCGPTCPEKVVNGETVSVCY